MSKSKGGIHLLRKTLLYKLYYYLYKFIPLISQLTILISILSQLLYIIYAEEL